MSTISDARDKMAKSLIDLVDFKITVPLTTRTKNIHTNSFIYFEPLDFMDEMDNIYNGMTNTSGVGPSSTRFVPYRKGYWYVKGVRIVYGTDKTMELTLAPMPTVFEVEKITNNRTTSGSTGKTSSKTSSTSSAKIRTPSWLSKSDKDFIRKIIIKAIGTKKDILAQANACISYFNSKHVYSFYNDFDHGMKFRSTWNDRGLNCGDGALLMCYLLYCLGLDPKMKLGSAGEIGENYGHYWGVVKIKGKTYYFDHANCTGCKGRAKLRTSGTDYGHRPRGGSYVSWH